MKKLILFLCICTLSFTLTAQTTPSDGAAKQRAAYLTQYLTDMLQLDENQQVQVQSIYGEYMQKLFDLVSQNNGNKDVFRDKKESLEKQRQSQIQEVLNAEQQTKFETFVAERQAIRKGTR